MSQPSAADRAVQPFELDTQVTTAVGIILSALALVRPSTVPVVGQGFFGSPSFGILCTYAPPLCRPATFSATLANGLDANGVCVVRVLTRRLALV
jgi:polysaccharide biosynthesis protein PslF